MDVIATVFGAGTVVLSLAVSVPQYVRSHRNGDVSGVSLPAAMNSALSFLAWTLYASWVGDGWLIASSALGLPFAIVMAAAVWRSRADREGLWVTALWLCTLLLSCGVQWLSGWNLVGIAVGASISWYVVPAAAKAWATKNVSGVAAGSW